MTFYGPAQASTITIPDTSSFSETREKLGLFTNDFLSSYDNILNFIQKLESGALDDAYTEEELEQIINFVVMLARQGILPDGTNKEIILENDIEELLQEEENPYEYSFSFSIDKGEYLIIPALSTGREDVILCGWIKKKIKKVKKFVKEHAAEIIIGTIVVVAVVVVVVTTAGAAAPVAAAAAGAGASASASSSESDNKEKNNSEATHQEGTPTIPADVNNAPSLQTVLEEHVSSFKELVVEDNLLQNSANSQNNNYPFFEVSNTRELGARLAHQTLDGVSQLASFVPQIMEEISEIGSKILPNNSLPKNDLSNGSPTENYEKTIKFGHQKIDQAFSTDQADSFTQESPSKIDFAIGLIPPPGLLSLDTATMNFGRLPPTLASNIIGWEIGQPITNLTKSGNVPKWSTVRKRYWKNRAEWAKSNPNDYGAKNIQRMEQGLAPQKIDSHGGLISKELHHNPAQRDGGLFDFMECWPEEHAFLDQNRYIGQ